MGEIDVAVHIPIAVAENSTVNMTCSYNLYNNPLYSVKWYKGRNEFFRFIPKEMPPIIVFQPFSNIVNVRTIFNLTSTLFQWNIRKTRKKSYCRVQLLNHKVGNNFVSFHLFSVKIWRSCRRARSALSLLIETFSRSHLTRSTKSPKTLSCPTSRVLLSLYFNRFSLKSSQNFSCNCKLATSI